MHSILINTTPQPTKVEFESKMEKGAYIKEEFQATLQNRNWRYSCPAADMSDAIRALAKAQIAFAIMCGFSASNTDKYTWQRKQDQPRAIS